MVIQNNKLDTIKVNLGNRLANVLFSKQTDVLKAKKCLLIQQVIEQELLLHLEESLHYDNSAELKKLNILLSQKDKEITQLKASLKKQNNYWFTNLFN